jgi:hypothetical protein
VANKFVTTSMTKPFGKLTSPCMHHTWARARLTQLKCALSLLWSV